MMLHNEARNLLVEAYEKTHDAKGGALGQGDIRLFINHSCYLFQIFLRQHTFTASLADAQIERRMEWVCEENPGVSSVFSG